MQKSLIKVALERNKSYAGLLYLATVENNLNEINRLLNLGVSPHSSIIQEYANNKNLEWFARDDLGQPLISAAIVQSTQVVTNGLLQVIIAPLPGVQSMLNPKPPLEQIIDLLQAAPVKPSIRDFGNAPLSAAIAEGFIKEGLMPNWALVTLGFNGADLTSRQMNTIQVIINRNRAAAGALYAAVVRQDIAGVTQLLNDGVSPDSSVIRDLTGNKSLLEFALELNKDIVNKHGNEKKRGNDDTLPPPAPKHSKPDSALGLELRAN